MLFLFVRLFCDAHTQELSGLGSLFLLAVGLFAMASQRPSGGVILESWGLFGLLVSIVKSCHHDRIQRSDRGHCVTRSMGQLGSHPE